MIISFYDNEFKGLQNNASLSVDNASYSLIRRGVELDEMSCTCEAFTENKIQPTFLVVKNDRGNYVYGALAGIPQLDKQNQTKITASDLKTMLKSDIFLDCSKKWSDVNAFLSEVFNEWNAQVNQGSFSCELLFNDNVGTVAFENLVPSAEKEAVYNAWEDIFAPYLKYYALYMTTELDLYNKRVIFRIGKSMCRVMNVKLWELGVYDYGKWIADVNETQGYVYNSATGQKTAGYRWILTSQNQITTNPGNRDVYPIKRKIILKETENSDEEAALLAEANEEALTKLTDYMFQENLELNNIQADFETRFDITVRRGEDIYKSLPCGALYYDCNGLIKVQIGYRFTGIQFLF